MSFNPSQTCLLENENCCQADLGDFFLEDSYKEVANLYASEPDVEDT